MKATYTYTVNSDAGLTRGIVAETIDDAARQWAKVNGFATDENYGVADLIEDIEEIEGAWLWIESNDAPDGNREYAGKENMA